jgi:hypothetical protein
MPPTDKSAQPMKSSKHRNSLVRRSSTLLLLPENRCIFGHGWFPRRYIRRHEEIERRSISSCGRSLCGLRDKWREMDDRKKTHVRRERQQMTYVQPNVFLFLLRVSILFNNSRKRGKKKAGCSTLRHGVYFRALSAISLIIVLA